jgi:hypothetical protein
MSCDPSWEVCDTTPAESTTTAPSDDSAGPKPNKAAKDVAVIFSNMMWASMLANCYGVGSNSYYVSSEQASALDKSGYTANAAFARASSTWKATKYLGWVLTPFGIIGWILFLANTFFDGKGGPIQTATTFFVKAAGPVGIITILLTFYRSFSRKTCVKDATSWQCTKDNSTDYLKW